MITLIEAKNYRCLQYIRQPLGPFHVLVGPNASGKTTFLDVVAFLSDLVHGGLDHAVGMRSQNFMDLIWRRRGTGFELAVEATIPDDLQKTSFKKCDTIRYEIGCAVQEDSGEFLVVKENLFLLDTSHPSRSPAALLEYIAGGQIPETLRPLAPSEGIRIVFARDIAKDDLFFLESEVAQPVLFPDDEPRRSMLQNLPEHEKLFPISSWFKRLLRDGVQSASLDHKSLRLASRPGQTRNIKLDGSNIPWIVNTIRVKSWPSYRRWVEHLRTALPDLVDVDTVEREDDRHRYIVLCYENGLRVPSWMASDGSMRLIALTLLAYLPDIQGLYLMEEPENGIHPRAIETMFQSLSSVYNAQILLATHSPVILSMAEASDILCFAKTPEGAADIVRGSEHPALSSWHGETNLGVLFASGVLG
jgi:predicted ATPase